MANVISRGAGGRDRSQMLLVAAFGVAVMLVALALILNTAIYTENLATRGSDISGGKDALRYRAATEESLRGTLMYVNVHNNTTSGPYSDVEDPATRAVKNFSNMSGRQQAADSIVANVSLERINRGVRVFQRTDDGNFSNENDDVNWTVLDNTDGLRSFEIGAPRTGLENESVGGAKPSSTDPVFFVNMSDDADGEWYHIYIYNESGVGGGTRNVVVQVDGNSITSSTCSASYGPDDRAQIDVTNASVEGQRCQALEKWTPILSDGFEVRFNNTRDGATIDDQEYNVNGSYSMVADTGNLNDANVLTGTVPPHKTKVIYSMTAHLTYESKRLYFGTDVRVAPGEPDE